MTNLEEPKRLAERLKQDPGDGLCGLTEREIHNERIDASDTILSLIERLERAEVERDEAYQRGVEDAAKVADAL